MAHNWFEIAVLNWYSRVPPLNVSIHCYRNCYCTAYITARTLSIKELSHLRTFTKTLLKSKVCIILIIICIMVWTLSTCWSEVSLDEATNIEKLIRILSFLALQTVKETHHWEFTLKWYIIHLTYSNINSNDLFVVFKYCIDRIISLNSAIRIHFTQRFFIIDNKLLRKRLNEELRRKQYQKGESRNSHSDNVSSQWALRSHHEHLHRVQM